MTKLDELKACLDELIAAQAKSRRCAVFYWASMFAKTATEYTHDVISAAARDLQIEDEPG